jgi:predicted GNAT family acetyltransferase
MSLPTKLDSDEPQLMLDLAALRLPDDPSLRLSAITPDLKEIAINWRTEYIVSLLGEPEDKAQDTARAQIEKYIINDSHRLLVQGGQPVSMTGFNARYKDHVQIGGVFTPPALRRQGYATAAISLHLAEARSSCYAVATLFAANDEAASVYRRMGFQDCGCYSLVLFEREEAAA